MDLLDATVIAAAFGAVTALAPYITIEFYWT